MRDGQPEQMSMGTVQQHTQANAMRFWKNGGNEHDESMIVRSCHSHPQLCVHNGRMRAPAQSGVGSATCVRCQCCILPVTAAEGQTVKCAAHSAPCGAEFGVPLYKYGQESDIRNCETRSALGCTTLASCWPLSRLGFARPTCTSSSHPMVTCTPAHTRHTSIPNHNPHRAPHSLIVFLVWGINQC